MTGLPRDFKPEKIIVKIDNMKRRSYGNSPPISRKKRRSSINRHYSSSDERRSPELVRRRYRSPPSPRPSRFLERDEFGRFRDLGRSHPSYKVLAVSALHPEASDEQVKETLYRKYREFGEMSVRISHDIEERVAYVCFRSSEDARNAKHSKPRISLFDKIALVAPVYSSDHYKPRTRRSPSRSFSPDFDQKYYQSPIPPELHRSHLSDRFYERIPRGTLPPMLPPRDFREVVLPPIHPHERMISRGPLLHDVAPIHPHLGPTQPLYAPSRHFMPPLRPTHPHLPLIHEKKSKFPNYLHHIPPEDDPLATRTLFVGNLEISISDEELQCIFGRYGIVEDIDVKRPLPGSGNAYAFVRYQNLNMAHVAKVELSGQYIGKLQCKIGYGKPTPTQRIWVGGLSPWTSLAQLEREFDRFGVINKIEYVISGTYAFIQFESIDAATAAVKEMRGVALGGTTYKLRTDFADDGICGSPTLSHSSKSKSPHDDVAATAGDSRELSRQDEFPYGCDGGEYPSSPKSYQKVRSQYGEVYRDFDDYTNEHTFEQGSVSDIISPRSPERSPLHQSMDSDVESKEGSILSLGPLASVHTLSDLASNCTDIWQGSLVLKISQFSAIFHFTSGNPNIIEFLKNEDGNSTLRITQRLRLDKSKLQDVSKLILTDDMHAIFLAMPCLSSSVANYDASVQTRPLHNLITYLKQKQAAGVVKLVGLKPNGVLYAFPPCEYSASLLKQSAKNLSTETLNDDHLVIVVVSKDIFK